MLKHAGKLQWGAVGCREIQGSAGEYWGIQGDTGDNRDEYSGIQGFLISDYIELGEL